MYRSLFVWMLFCLTLGSAWADDREIIEKAQTAYRAGDYAGAFETLSHLPSLLGVVPLLDRPQQSRRAEIFLIWGAFTWLLAIRLVRVWHLSRYFTWIQRPTRGL